MIQWSVQRVREVISNLMEGNYTESHTVVDTVNTRQEADYECLKLIVNNIEVR